MRPTACSWTAASSNRTFSGAASHLVAPLRLLRSVAAVSTPSLAQWASCSLGMGKRAWPWRDAEGSMNQPQSAAPIAGRFPALPPSLSTTQDRQLASRWPAQRVRAVISNLMLPRCTKYLRVRPFRGAPRATVTHRGANGCKLFQKFT